MSGFPYCHQNIHRSGKLDWFARIEVISGATGDVPLLLVAVVDVRHLNNAADLNDPILEHLGVHLHP
ncbi:hypothetical protein I9P40_22705 [Citrobacter portucalensis]|nr:hypothetical protein I9P40_22705 [Citrobacter portucalensis]